MRKLKTGKAAAILLTLVLSSALFTGCGSSNPETSAKTAQDAAASDSTSDTEGALAESEEAESEESYEPATIRIGVGTGRTPHLTALVAQQEGIFEKYNLNVELVEFSAGIDTVNAIELGQVDVGYVADFAGMNRLGNLSDPNDSNLRFIGRLEKTATLALYVNPDTVSSLEDLKGKSIGLQLGTIVEYFNINALLAGGLTVDDVNNVSVDSVQTGLALVEKGEIDAYWTTYANIPKVKEYGFTELITQEELGLYQNSLYVTTDSYISSDSEVIARFLKATAESYEYIAENFDQAVADISGVTGMETSIVADSLKGTSLQLDFPKELLDDLSAMDEWLIDNGYYENSVDFSQYIDTDILKEAIPEADVY